MDGIILGIVHQYRSHTTICYFTAFEIIINNKNSGGKLCEVKLEHPTK